MVLVFCNDIIIANNDNTRLLINVDYLFSLADIWCLPVVCVED